jgi:PIN domain nuclease of toxin-antitoxin system
VILLDTHTWLWWVQGVSASLQAKAAERIRTADVVAVASVSCLEAKSAALPDIHRDPIDRVIVATAIEHGAKLLSKDEVVARYPGLQVRWDQ